MDEQTAIRLSKYAEKYNPAQLKILTAGTASLIAVIGVPKHNLMQASSKESEFNRELFHARPIRNL